MCRTLTLSFPTVWADIDFHDPAYFATCLERSQRLPISIKFDTWLRHRKYAFESSIITWGLQTIHKEFHRIYNLIISCQLDLANQDLFDQNSSQELPLLVDLEINLRQRSESARPPNPAFCFTRWLLAHSAPRLKKLVIRDLSFEWWQCRTFPSGLTHLSISMFYNGFQGHDYCTLAEVLTCLGQLSSLENLDLSGALPINTRPISGSRGVALTPMPQLKLLTLESLLRSAIHFLTYLQLPPLVAVWISGGGIDHDGGEYKDLCSDLIPFMQGRTALQSYKSMVSFGIVNDLGNGGSVSFLGSRSFSSSLDSLVAEYHLTLDFKTRMEDSKLTKDVCDSFHDALKHIRALFLDMLKFFNLDFFLANFRTSKHLLRLGLSEYNALILPELLLSTPEEDSNETEGNFIFPELHSLIISGFVFKGARLGGLTEDAFFMNMVEAIQTRQKHGFGPHTLTFQDCTNFDESEKVVRERLSSLVVVVDTSTSPNYKPNEAGTYDDDKDDISEPDLVAS